VNPRSPTFTVLAQGRRACSRSSAVPAAYEPKGTVTLGRREKQAAGKGGDALRGFLGSRLTWRSGKTPRNRGKRSGRDPACP